MTLADHLMVFGAMALTDTVWALYIRAVADKRRLRAPALSSAIILLGAYVTRSYVHDVSALIDAAFGAWVGTAFAIRVFK